MRYLTLTLLLSSCGGSEANQASQCLAENQGPCGGDLGTCCDGLSCIQEAGACQPSPTTPMTPTTPTPCLGSVGCYEAESACYLAEDEACISKCDATCVSGDIVGCQGQCGVSCNADYESQANPAFLACQNALTICLECQ